LTAPALLLAALTVFEGARVIVGDGTVIEDAILVVRDGVIESVGPRNAAVVPPEASRVSLPGKTLMPLLVDIHGHIGYLKDGVFAAGNYGSRNIEDQLRILESFGVGAFLSLGTDIGPDAWKIREEQRAGRIGGARLLVAGRGFVAPGGGPTVSPLEHVPYEVDRPEIARLLVRELAEQRADMVKVWVDDRNGTRPKLPPEIYRAVIDEAHARGLRVMAHVYYLADAKELLRAGVDGFAHMVRDVELDEEFTRLAKERKVFQAAALAIQAKPFQGDWLQDPAFRCAASAEAIARLERGETGFPGTPTPEQTEQFKALMRKNVGKLRDAGIRIALGGDTGIPTRFVGYNEHLELQALVEAGLTPLEAISAGTKTGAEILGLRDLGELAPGKSADFLVLDASPLESIANTTRIAAVYRRGVRIGL
jgi:imidazolonepropionase-like amidohydrolase